MDLYLSHLGRLTEIATLSITAFNWPLMTRLFFGGGFKEFLYVTI